MKLITEDIIKKIIKAGKLVVDGELQLPADCMLTPSAQAVVIEQKLSLRLLDKPEGQEKAFSKSPHGRCYKTADGRSFDYKPEHMTQLSGDLLVTKDNPRIRLRGEIDILIAELLKVQWRAAALGCTPLVSDLEDVYSYIKQLSSAEVRDEPFIVATVIGYDYQQIRSVSHHPNKHFGRGHLFNISYQEGELPLLLNALRALSRRTELAFFEAFKEKDGVQRPDLMEGFNRLSSALSILSLRAVSGYYGEMK